MRALTGEATTLGGVAALLRAAATSSAIKVNAGGRPYCVSSPGDRGRDRAPAARGRPARRRRSWSTSASSASSTRWTTRRSCRRASQIHAAERGNRSAEQRDYDPRTYVEAQFFGEEDTRSNMMRLVTERVTKIVNVPNMKDHGATGVTGCLKNIAYGSFSNVARTHARGVTPHAHGGRDAGGGRAAALAHGAADHGRPARRLARRPVRAHPALPVLPAPDPVRDRPGGDRPAAARRHRRRSARRRARSRSGTARRPRCASTTRVARDADPNVNILIREPRPRGVRGPARASASGISRRSGSRRSRCEPRAAARGAAGRSTGTQPADDGAGAARSAGIEQAARAARARRGVEGGRPRRRCRSSRARALRAGRAPGARDRRRAPTGPPRRGGPGSTPTAGATCAEPQARYFEERAPARRVLAAAEAFAYGADLVLAIDPADLAAARRGARASSAALPEGARRGLADLAVVDDGSLAAGELMNLLARRNLLFRPVSRPAPGAAAQRSSSASKQYPKAEAGNPDALALKIRAQLGGRAALAAHLRERGRARPASRATRAGLRLQLLNYGGREIEGLRVRLRGEWTPGEALVLPARQARRRGPAGAGRRDRVLAAGARPVRGRGPHRAR